MVKIQLLVRNMKILIIADDITGSLDTGAKFAARGLSADIIGIEGFEQKLGQCGSDVAVINAESRHLSTEDAYKTVFIIVAAASKMGIPVILKKTDSVLRGHIGAELEAAAKASGGKKVYLIPAYPDQGRTTVGGRQYLNGIPIDKSGFSKDMLDPVTESDIVRIIARESDISAVSLRSGEAVEAYKGSIVILDAQDAQDMKCNVRVCLSQPERPLVFAGCAGLAMELAEAFSDQSCKIPDIEDRSLAVVCGSCSPVTLRQLDYAEENGCERVSFTISELVSRSKSDTYLERIDRIREICALGSTLIIDISRETVEEYPEMDVQQISREIVDGLSNVVTECEDALKEYTLLLTGGDTLSAYMRRNECSRVELLGEMFPGVAVSRFTFGRSGRTQYIISKSGGYGFENVVIQCAKLLKRGTVNEED